VLIVVSWNPIHNYIERMWCILALKYDIWQTQRKQEAQLLLGRPTILHISEDQRSTLVERKRFT